jgi:hypothetical protein
MIVNRLLVLSLAVAGCAAAVLAVGRRTRRMAKRELKEELQSWEDEGGHLAPAEAPGVAHPAVAP